MEATITKTHSETPILFKRRSYMDKFPVYLNSCTVTPDSDSPLHYHDFIEICYVAEGRGYHQVRQAVRECTKGDIYIIDTGVPHCFFEKQSSDDHMIINNLLFVPEFIYNEDYSHHDIIDIYKQLTVYVLSHDTEAIKVSLTPAQFEAITAMYQDIKSEAEHNCNGALAVINAQLTIFLIKLVRFLEENVNERISYLSPGASIVDSAKKFIAQNFFYNHLTIDMVARNVYTGKTYLSRMFKKVTGEYFSDYLRRIRMEEACRLLRETDLTNEQIIETCGFHDVPNFYASFKKYMGTTPKQYRLTQKSQQNKELIP